MVKIAFTDDYRVELPDKHRFPMLKYELVREQLLFEGVIKPEQLFSPELIDDETVEWTHCPTYWQKVKNLALDKNETRRIGFPQTAAFVRRWHASASATCQVAKNALTDGLGISLAGGTHHAFANRGEGFCVLNDVAVSANQLLNQGLIKKALIIDVDVHQGNGTAAIFANDDRVFTYSIHCKENYPLVKEKSDLDVELPAQTGDAEYLKTLALTLPNVIKKAKPDLVYYLGGVDVLATDALGKLNLSREGCLERDYFVFSQLKKLNLPVAVVMAGGYSPRLHDIVSAHLSTYKIALDFYE